MKRKSIFLFLSMMILGVCSTLGFFHIKSEHVYAESTTASVWDGEYENDVADTDFFTCNGNCENGDTSTHHHILTAKGFGFFARRVISGLYPFINETVYLDRDIDLKKLDWAPIGHDDGHAFKGAFNGQGHYIYNLKISNPKEVYKNKFGTELEKINYAGLFGTTTGSVKNLNLKYVDINVSDVENVGAVAGNLTGSALQNISVEGSMHTSCATYVGGVVGQSSTTLLRNVSKLFSDVEIVATACASDISRVGGVLGKFAVGNGLIEEVAFKGSVAANATYTAGLVGQLDSFAGLKNSYNVGSVNVSKDVSAGANTAGIAGLVNGTSTGANRFENVYNAGQLNWLADGANNYCAGLVSMFGNGKSFAIENSFNISTPSEQQKGNNFPLFRDLNNATVSLSNVWYNVDKNSTEENAVRDFATMVCSKGTYTGGKYFAEASWDFETVWSISSGVNDGLPFLKSSQNVGTPDNDKVINLLGDGSFENPYLIFTAADIGYISANYDKNNETSWQRKYYSLQNDIDLTGKNWQPIGATTTNAFSGVFDGNGYAVYGMTCSLQHKFSYHGLFGVTDGAVIKNLEINNVRFVNGGSGENEDAGILGAFVGYAQGETYLVNCKDSSNVNSEYVETLNAVGKVDDGKLTVAYGKANIENDKIAELSLPDNANIAYDVEIDGFGGAFYDKGKVVKGEYHILVGNDGAILSQSIDEALKVELPQLSEKFSDNATLIKKGFKLSQFKLAAEPSRTFEIDATTINVGNKANLISGLVAVFEDKKPKKIKVVYNQYEKENFGAVSTASYVTSDIFEVEYDSVLSLDYPEIFDKKPTKDGKQLLRGDKFSIEGFYFREGQELFGKEVDQSAFANDGYLGEGDAIGEVYVKWIGSDSENAMHQFKVSFSKIDDSILGRFDLIDAIDSVILELPGQDDKIVGSLLENSDGTVSAAFDFDTRFSALKDDGIKLSIRLESGFECQNQIIRIGDFSQSHDFNFGHLRYNDTVIGGGMTAPGESVAFAEKTFANGVVFKNLDEDYCLNVCVQRKMFSTATNISSDEVFFAIAPNISNVKEVSIFESGFEGDPNTVVPTTKRVDNTYLGYDVVSKKFVSATHHVGTPENPSGEAFDFDMTGYTDILLGFKFDGDISEETRYFKFVKEEIAINVSADKQETFDAYTMYEVVFEDGQWKYIDLIVRIRLSKDNDFEKLYYLTGAQFSIIGSVKDDLSDTVITENSYNHFGEIGQDDLLKNADTEILVGERMALKKLRHEIFVNEILGTKSSTTGISEDYTSQIGAKTDAETKTIVLVSKYTKVSFDWEFVEIVGNEKRVISSDYAPTVNLPKGTNYQLPEGETRNVPVAVEFTSSDYYRLLESKNGDGKIAIVLRDGNLTGAENILISAQAVASEGTETDNGQAWINSFDDRNKNYFGASMVAKNGDNGSLGYPVADKSKTDVYSFSLVFGDSDGRSALRAGRYLVQFVCQPVDYSLDFDAQFVEYKESNSYSKEDLAVEGGENAPKVFASVKDEDGETSLLSGDSSLRYDTTLKMETMLGESNAYVFYDWFVEGEKWSGFLSDQKLNHPARRMQSFEFDYASLYDFLPADEIAPAGAREYKLKLSAVYVRKEIHISLNERVSVAGQDVYVTAKSLGVDIAMSNFDYSYSYQSSVDESKNWNISFAKGGTNGDSYYFSGFIILNASNAVVKTISVDTEPAAFNENGVFNNNYSIKSFVLDKLENEETLSVSTAYTLVPMLTRKTANLYVVSGTGSGIDGKFTDGKNGDVFYLDEQNEKVSTTETKVEIGNVNVGTTLYLNFEINAKVDGVEQAVVVDKLYAQRTGYSIPANGFWTWSNGASSGILNGSQLYIASSYFEGTQDTETSISLALYRTWVANTYSVTFARNQGLFAGENSSNESVAVSVLYDQKVSNALTLDDISRVGYELAGWTRVLNDSQEMVFDAEGQSVACEGVFDAEGNYVLVGNLNVYALWRAKNYKVQLVTNGANTIAGQEAEETVEFEIAYGSTFQSAFENLGLLGGENAPTREGFVFNEVFASGSFKQTITSSTVFGETLPGCVLREDGSASLTLYIDWQFDSSYLDLTFNETVLKKAYTASDITFNIAEYFKNGFTAKGYVVEIVDDQTVSITVGENVHAKVKIEIISETVAIDGNSSFTVRNVNQYNFSLVLSLEDLIYEGTTIYSKTINLYAEIEPATLSAVIDENNESVWLVNVQRLMSNFVSSSVKSRLESCATFGSFVNNVLKGLDKTIPSNIANKQAYEFVAYKYYYMITATDYTRYKNMTYSDFEILKSENPTDVENVLSRIYFFNFFDRTNTSSKEISMYNKSVCLTSSTVEDPNAEISLDRVEIVADEINVEGLYYFRAVIKNAGDDSNLNNYNLSFDENGEAYIYLGRIYILPEIFVIEDRDSSKASYYNSSLINVSVAWQGNRDALDMEGLEEYFEIDNNLFARANLYTSNLGRQTLDTDFTFVSDENYLYFANVSVLERRQDEEGKTIYVDISNRMKFVLEESFVYTILNIDGVASVDVSAKYLSFVDGFMSFADMPTTIGENLLKITQVSYDLGGGIKRIANTADGLEAKSYEEDGNIICQIERNNDNTVSIIMSKFVKTVTVMTTEKSLTEYIALYKWTEAPTYNIDGTMEKNTSFVFEKDSLVGTEGSMTKGEFYAVYTDMVQVSYNLNFPENFATSSPTTSWLKLGQSTVEELLLPQENGFKLASLTSTKTKESYETIFDSVDGKFKGIIPTNRHAKVELEAKWTIEEMRYEQTMTEYKTSVYGFDYLSASSVVSIFNKNELLFNYTYEWFKGEDLVSKSERLTLAGNGTVEESGQYRLVVTANVKKEFLTNTLVSDEGATSSLEVSFEMEFMKNKLVSIDFAGDSEFSYDGSDHMNGWHVSIQYSIFDSNTGEYSENPSVVLEYYVGAKNLDFVIKRNGIETTTMTNAGTYTISVAGNDGVYVNALEFGAVEFEVVVNPFVVELSEFDIKFSKNFNENDPTLSRELYLANENVMLRFARKTGEAVGKYDLTLAGILEDKKDNYVFKMNDAVIFENGKLTEIGKTAKIGDFEILTSGTLTFFYEVTDSNPETIEVNYSAAGYRVELDGWNLKIFNGETLLKTLSLQMRDEVTGEVITKNQILQILSDNFAKVKINFFDTALHETITASGTYTYMFSGLDEISKYYSNVTFAQGYQFVIGKILIDVSTLGLNKVYNGKTVEYFDAEGVKIEDIDSFSGVYVSATYENAHVGQTKVDLSLHDTNDSGEVSNYQLSEGSLQATISKLSARLTARMSKDVYEYGEISLGNLDSHVDKNYVIVDADGNDVSNLLALGYYNINYSLLASTKTNDNGYVFAGNYQLQATASFDDFNMTLVLPEIEIVAKRIEKGISVGQFSILASETVAGSYSEIYTINETGDSIEIVYTVVGLTAGSAASVGFYNLKLAFTKYLNSSVEVVIDAENKGFEVKTEENLVYIVLDKTALDLDIYNGYSHNFSVDVSAKKLSIESNGVTSYVDIEFVYANGGASADDVVLSDLQIFSGTNTTSFVDAGTYRLSFKATSSTHSNFAFQEEYNYKIAKKEIDASALNLERTYSGSSTFTIDDFDEKIGADGVSLVARYASANVGDDIDVTLFLQGTKSINYELKNTDNLKGKITKADAYIELSKTNFVYGNLTSRDSVPYNVLSGGLAVSSSQYNIVLSIVGATYSSVGYLDCNNYLITLDASSMSQNYNLIFADNQRIAVDAMTIDVNLSTSGQFSYIYGASETTTDVFVGNYQTILNETIALTFTREAGQEVGYYKILSSTSNSSNYVVSTTTDRSEGAFRITKAQDVIYVLMSNSDVVSGSDKEVSSITYDGNLYDKVSVVQKVGGKTYQLVFESTANASAKQYYDLNYYTYDADADEYTRLTDVTIDGLKANIEFANGVGGKNVGEYLLNVLSASADNFSVVLGKYGLQSFYLNIDKRDVLFLDSIVSKVFDNQDAEISYNDVSEILSGVLTEELGSLTLRIRLTENGKLAKYVGYTYAVEAVLEGGETNYNLHLQSADGKNLVGQILPADLTITVNDQSFVYGEEIRLDFEYSAEIDLNRYERGIDASLVPIAQDEDYSTSGCLRVGDYELACLLGTPDFKAVYVVNGTPANDLADATVTILQKALTLEGVKESLEEIFTKTYDSTNVVNLVDEAGDDRLRLLGVVSRDKTISDESGATSVVRVTDDVLLVGANYATEFIGQAITITFTLGGTESDFSNYKLASYEYGVIEPVVVKLTFNYNADGSNVKSNVENNNLPQISALAFPFMDDSTLTANSAHANTTSVRNFPTNLTGKTGYMFQKWTLSFKNIAEDSTKYEYLTSVLRVYGLAYVYENDEFKIDVSNNAETVGFLKTLLGNESDVLGTYYQNHEEIEFVFDANWEINKYQVSIKVADEKGADASLGKVMLDCGDGKLVEITSSYSAKYDYGTKLTLLAIANDHCSYYGFYNATGSIHYDNGTVSGVSVSPVDDGVLLTVSNLGATYNFVARFQADKVDVSVDLSGATDATISSDKFSAGENGAYLWKATYLELQNFSLANIGLSREGFALVSISDGKTEYSDFANTKLSDLVSDGQTSLTLVPKFTAVGVVVTLNFADGKTPNKNITVPFKESYSHSDQWIETPTREGYQFEGWFDSKDNQITGESVLSTVENHTLTAKWQILNFDLTLLAENVSISSDDVRFVVNGNEYSLADVDFGTEISFKVSANVGYELTQELVDSWSEFFVVNISGKTAVVTLKMPAQDVSCTISSSPILNTISIVGDNIGEILAYEVSQTETSLEVKDGKVKISTGKTLKLVISAEYGYQMIEEFVCQDPDAVVTVSIENDIMTLTITNILRDITVELSTLEVINDITIKFGDNSMIEDLMVGGFNYKDLENLKPFRAVTGETLEMYIKYKHGFEYDTFETEQNYQISCSLATEGLYGDEGYYKVVISNIESDGQIRFVGKRARFTINTQVLSYDENKQPVVEPANKIVIAQAGQGHTSFEGEFGTVINLSYEMLSTYNFAGWSKDGVKVFSTDENLSLTIEDDETIYAIFSSMKFTMRFGTFNNFTLYSEYGNAALESNIYEQISGRGERYIDADTGNDLHSLVLYYGASKTVTYVVPTGYRFYGFGMYVGERFVMLDIAESDARQVQFTISSLDLDENVTNFVLYVVVKAYSFSINVNSEIDIDGIREENIDVGGAELQGDRGQGVNAYGYIDGTRTRYSAEDFVNGVLLDDRQFRIVGYTGENVYIKVTTKRVGYKFLDVVTNSRDITLTQISKDDTSAVYMIYGAIGGTEIDIDVLFKPNLNDIKIGFKLGENDTDGGAITYAVDSHNKHKVFASGKDYSSITVAAYTDSTFEVFAYVRTGFYIDPEDIQIICENDIIDRSSIQYSLLSIGKDGYTGRVRFVVRDYLFKNEIYILLDTTKYTVKLVDEGKTLALVKNVEFGSRLNLYQENQDNIQIIGTDTGLEFVDGKLEFLMQRQNYRFEGLFTSENGAGVMYIDANGRVIQDWYESGYKLNSLTSKYELTENAFFNEQTGEMEISLYVYWSYYKTRIRFNIVPDVNLNVTAKDMISGIDYTNSWFYPSSKYYIEVAFNTNIYIKAPKISGYKFYKFVIKQKDINGNSLEDVVTFSEEVPWSTNELDNIVECEVQIIYFAQIDVVVFGGDGGFKIEQEALDSQAMSLNAEKYVDTTKPFKLIAEFDENNFEFVRWNNITSGQSWWTKEWEGLRVYAKTTLILNLQGKTFSMTFKDETDNLYDFTFGQVLNVITTSIDNNVKVYRLGYYSGGRFISTLDTVDVKVGDRVTFAVSVERGFAVLWGREDITYARYADGLTYFDMLVENCPADGLLRIVPQFKNEVLSIYVNRDFVEKDKVSNAMDMNLVSAAGHVTFSGKKTDFISVSADVESINIKLVTRDRYKVSSIVVKNYDKVFANLELFTNEKGDIVFTRQFLDENQIVGSIQIEIEYERILWENHSVTHTSFAGSGTDEDPYQISSIDDLVLMMRLCNNGAVSTGGRQFRSASYILLADIDLSEKFWTPIGTIENSFNGYFDFNGHRVTGIYNALFYDSVSYGGLFGVLSLNAVFVKDKPDTWYIYLIIGIAAALVVVIVILIILARRRKKRREKLAKT